MPALQGMYFLRMLAVAICIQSFNQPVLGFVLSDHPLFAAAAHAQAQCRQIGFLFALVCAGIIAGKAVGRILVRERCKGANL